MNISLDVHWKAGNKGQTEIDPRLLPLLKAIRDTGSLKAAASHVDVSYRFAWGLVRDWGEYFGGELAVLTKGRGASLSAVGEKLLWAEKAIESRLSVELQNLSQEINKELEGVLSVQGDEGKLNIFASNGLAISVLNTLCQKSEFIMADFQFRGSLESLRLLANSNCDIAGFHFPTGRLAASLAPLYRQWLDEEKHSLLHVATRQQGLIFQPKNPHRIKGIRDLTKRSLRFVNRQEHSGTRTILDGLLQQEGISKNNIKGYHDEEFTHMAVAAMIASNAADVGFGIKAAAAKFGLGFLPLVEETYLLALSQSIASQSAAELKNILGSKSFKSRVNSLPGYNTKQSGRQVKFANLL